MNKIYLRVLTVLFCSGSLTTLLGCLLFVERPEQATGNRGPYAMAHLPAAEIAGRSIAISQDIVSEWSTKIGWGL